MKNILYLVFIFSLISCADDDFLRSDLERLRNNQVAETPPEGLKLKSKYGLLSQQFFYNQNGFIDSISSYHSWGDDFSQKYIYNNLNQIIEYRYVVDEPHYPQAYKKEITFYTYNTFNQIISSLTYDKNNIAIAYKTFNYNKDGTLFSPNKVIANGNVVQDGSTKYQFDTFRNPYYNIYPKAYRILNFINKNNILLTERNYTSEVHINVHTLKYNSENYIIEEHISDMPLDTDDHRGFSYY